LLVSLIIIIGLPGLVGWFVKLIVLRFNGGNRFWAAIIGFVVTFALMVAYSWVNWAQTGLFTAIGLPVAAIGHLFLDLLIVAHKERVTKITDADDSAAER
jgi:hypothetical protein